MKARARIVSVRKRARCSLGLCMVCTRCGIIGANARPNCREHPERERLTRAHAPPRALAIWSRVQIENCDLCSSDAAHGAGRVEAYRLLIKIKAAGSPMAQ